MNAPSSGGERFVRTVDIGTAVKGRETDVLDALRIDWRTGRPHIPCPYPEHTSTSSWRWDVKKAKA
jgi:hypothetical protein